jgi:hypothetical protein
VHVRAPLETTFDIQIGDQTMAIAQALLQELDQEAKATRACSRACLTRTWIGGHT